MVLWELPTSSYSESFRQIRANFQFAIANLAGNTFLVSSPGPEEGKSTVLSNLAVAIAQTGKRVVVVDGDLRRPSLHRLFASKGREPGLSNVLADPDTALDGVIRKSAIEGVDIVPSGPTPPNPGELLGSSNMTSLLARLKEEYDFVLVDSPPVLPLADGSVIASKVDGVVIVVDGLSTRSSSLQATLESLQKTQVNIVGVIINKLKLSRFGYGYPYYYYYYRSYYSYAEPQEASVDGTGPFYRRLARRARALLPRSRRR